MSYLFICTILYDLYSFIYKSSIASIYGISLKTFFLYTILYDWYSILLDPICLGEARPEVPLINVPLHLRKVFLWRCLVSLSVLFSMTCTLLCWIQLGWGKLGQRILLKIFIASTYFFGDVYLSVLFSVTCTLFCWILLGWGKLGQRIRLKIFIAST